MYKCIHCGATKATFPVEANGAEICVDCANDPIMDSGRDESRRDDRHAHYQQKGLTMPNVFVCKHGPMGGVLIIFVCASVTDAKAFVRQYRAKHPRERDELFIFERHDG